ncbi:neuronal acetylcholine receptor subunit alpha-4-like [Ruditapes philippinarum]|uniref:neuronal acetylcholine receptor subunit alpha-4-like n=1 Tax=Ruditapes philippinarum TaxID=129788 RepID=UPI00295A86A7|nr:neuronal acetylcholine receptor subunit alpha-4-like [Ruditapes philippinarum]
MREFRLILTYLVIFSRLVLPVDGVYSAAKETEIRSETVLAAGYDMISRPSATTTVKVGISVLAIDELDLRSQKFQAAGWVTTEWEDNRLTWTPAAKDDIEEIFSKPGNIWKPELVVDNSYVLLS